MIEALPASPAPDQAWPGLKMLTGGKAYCTAPLGQLHYRDVGPRSARPPFLLIHQSPLSMVEFGAVQNSLADLGFRSIAVDTPGYGLSDQPGILPTIGGFADNLIALLDHLDLPRVVVGGHHTGACIATALAARHASRVAGVILHGCPLYTAEEAAAFRRHAEWDRTPRLDGAHLSLLFSDPEVLALLHEDALPVWTWMAVMMFLQGPDIGHWAVNRYDMARDLVRVRAPGMVLTDLEDHIHFMDHRAITLRPDFRLNILAERGTDAIMTNPGRWATLAAAFFQEQRL
jgi:pimeloyl-ACP methyl ester carboxylesterase